MSALFDLINLIKILFTQKEFSFGVIPIYKQQKTYIFLVIKQQDNHWGFPKGHKKTGESALKTAKRELEEETGINTTQFLKDITFTQTYSHKRLAFFKIYKKVLYFPALTQQTKVEIKNEIIDYRWLRYEDALRQLTFKENKDLLKSVHNYLKTKNI